MRDFSPAPWKITRLIPIGKEDNDYPGAEISLTERGGSQHTNAIQVWTDNAEDDAELIVAAHRMREVLLAVREALDDRSDAEYVDGTPVGNWAMRLLGDVDAVLEGLE
jgi:hypothetical protein